MLLKKFFCENVIAGVWKNEYLDGRIIESQLSVTFAKLKRADGKVRFCKSFDKDDLLKIRKVAGLAFEFLEKASSKAYSS